MADDSELQPRRYAILPDVEEKDVIAAQDGRPWRKSCGECAFRTSDPQDLGDAYRSMLLAGTTGTHFYCVHRDDDDGSMRICAAYGAVHRREARVAPACLR